MVLWIRPERLRFSEETVPKDAGAGEGSLPGRVLNRVFLGQQWLYEVGTEAGPLLMVAQNNGAAEHDVDAEIRLAAAPAGIRIERG